MYSINLVSADLYCIILSLTLRAGNRAIAGRRPPGAAPLRRVFGARRVAARRHRLL